MGALLTSLSAFAAAACNSPALGAFAGLERSRWEEFDAQGKSLLRERGTLTVSSLQASGRCSSIDWTAQWTHSHGMRDYDGVTSTQQPLQTQSRLRTQALTIAAWLPLEAAGWSVGSQLGYRQIQRDIANVGNVLGYPEQFEAVQAGLGMRYQAALGERVRFAAEGWLGADPGGRVSVDLPRADPVTLPLGKNHSLALSLQLEGGEAVQPGWSWHAEVAYRRDQTSAGAARALVRNGAIVGVALQPRIIQQHLGSNVALTYRF